MYSMCGMRLKSFDFKMRHFDAFQRNADSNFFIRLIVMIWQPKFLKKYGSGVYEKGCGTVKYR